jgi:alpha-1,3-rhamnosyl/mannosyltransferase
MRVAVDVSPLSHPPTGIGNYIRGSLAGMVAAAGPADEIVPFAPTSIEGPARIRARIAGLDVRPRLWPLPASHAVRTAWSIVGFPPAEWLVGRVDALLFTDWMTPPQRRGLRATTIHDLVPHHHPEWCTPRTIAMHRRKDAAALRCDVVFTNSAYTAEDASETLGLDRDRLVVAHPGLEPRHRPDGPRSSVAERYVLGVGTLEPRKNLELVIRAYAAMPESYRTRRPLVLVGMKGWLTSGLESLMQPLVAAGQIRPQGYTSDADLAVLYAAAQVLVYPSLYEGFGLPPLEAMASGTPVIVSNRSTLPEVVGEAGVQLDAADEPGLREALRRMDEDPAWWNARAVASLAQARQFSWARCARETLAVYRKVLGRA